MCVESMVLPREVNPIAEVPDAHASVMMGMTALNLGSFLVLWEPWLYPAA